MRADFRGEVFKKHAANLMTGITNEIERSRTLDVEITEHESIGTTDLDTRLGDNLKSAAIEFSGIVIKNNIGNIRELPKS